MLFWYARTAQLAVRAATIAKTFITTAADEGILSWQAVGSIEASAAFAVSPTPPFGGERTGIAAFALRQH